MEFDPTGIDRAIARLTGLLDLMDQQDGRVGGLRQVTQPGEAPSTRAFHGLFNRSMSRLSLRHNAFRRDVETRIEDLRKTRRTYTATDQAAAHVFRELA